WDLTFIMLNHLHALQPAVNLFMTLLLHQKDLARFQISNVEWSVLQDYEMILSMGAQLHVPHKVQQWMSSQARPTLSCAVLSFKLFMTIWEKKQEEHPCMVPLIEVGLAKARHYYN
ncbi:hypothetical protein F5141DRAFT_998727, partial [Pisolithus sp. B1]